MCERLGEVAELPFGDGVVLLGEEPDIVGQSEQPLEEGPCLVEAAHEGEVVGQPERTR